MKFAERVSFIGLSQVFNAVVNILMVPYLARALSIEEYGSYGQVLMIFGIAQVVVAFGLAKIVYVDLANQNLKEENTIVNIIASCCILGALGTSLQILTADYIAGVFNNQAIKSLIHVYSLSLLFSLVSGVLTSVLNFLQKVKHIALISLLVNLLRVLVTFIAIHFIQSLSVVFYGLLLISFVHVLLNLLNLPRSVLNGHLSWYCIRDQIKRGFPLSMSGVATILLIQTDGVMVSSMLGTASYAVYRMGAIPIPFLFLVYSSVITVTMVDVTKLYHQNQIQDLLQLKKQSSLVLALLIYPILIYILIFSKDILVLYLGERYVDSHSVFFIYNLVLFLRINDYRDILIAKGLTKYIMLADISIFTFNILLNLVLIKSFGIQGAAIASIVSYYLLSLCLLSITKKEIGVSFGDFFHYVDISKIIISSVLFGLCMYILYMYFEQLIMMLPLLILYFGGVYAVLVRLNVVPLDWLVEKWHYMRFLRYLSASAK